MKRLRLLWLLILAVQIGCAADGGPVGTGVSSSAAEIAGNVSAVGTANTSNTQSGDSPAIPPVQVSIEQIPDLTATTDAAGNFQLQGEFSGTVTVRFSTAAFAVTQPLDVPAGSTIVLENIQVQPRMVQIGAVRQLGFFGHVALADCAAGELLVDDRGAMAHQFMVRLLPETTIERGNGQTLPCQNIPQGVPVLIEGTIQLSDRTVNALTIIVVPVAAGGGPQPMQQIRFVGSVTFINCDASMMFISDASTGLTRVRFSAAAVVDGNHAPLTCQDIAIGDHVDGTGLIQIRNPGVVDALAMTVTAAVAP